MIIPIHLKPLVADYDKEMQDWMAKSYEIKFYYVGDVDLPNDTFYHDVEYITYSDIVNLKEKSFDRAFEKIKCNILKKFKNNLKMECSLIHIMITDIVSEEMVKIHLTFAYKIINAG
jgi:hypothetical protein